VPLAAMPEASINEDRELMPSQDQIGRPGESTRTSQAISVAGAMQGPPKRKLTRGARLPNARHQEAARGRRLRLGPRPYLTR
jgi:hypothetical protein